MKNFSFSLRACVLLASLTTLVVIGIYLYSSLSLQIGLSDFTREIIDRRVQSMQAAQNIKQSLTSYDNSLFRFFTTANHDELAHAKYLQQLTLSEITRAQTLIASPTVHQRLNLLRSEVNQYFSKSKKMMNYWKNHSLSDQAGLLKAISWARNRDTQRQELATLSAQGRMQLTRIYALCDELLTLNRVELESARQEMVEATEQNKKTALVWAAVAGGAILMIFVLLSFALLRPLETLMQSAKRIQDGELNFTIPVSRFLEIGRLTEAFNKMVQTIHQQHHRLLQETITDGLTGVYNQRHFRRIIHQELDRAQRTKDPLTLLMVDLDHFKTYNDSNGHELGNELLKKVCVIIKEQLREMDVLARYGGDEFSVILINCPLEMSRAIVERMVDAVSKFSFPAQHVFPKKKLTLSIGVACFPFDAKNADDLISKADEALYKVKQSGRDGVRWFRDTL